jgi:hypothetical protein
LTPADRKAIGEAGVALAQTPEDKGSHVWADRRLTLWTRIETDYPGRACPITTEAFDRVEVAVRAAYEAGAASVTLEVSEWRDLGAKLRTLIDYPNTEGAAHAVERALARCEALALGVDPGEP